MKDRPSPSAFPKTVTAITAVFGPALRYSPLLAIAFVWLALVSACDRSSGISQTHPGNGEWHVFQGTWIAAGDRQSIRLGGDRRASIANLSGSLLLSGASRPAVGFTADAIVLSDTATGLIGRAVWTDAHGDQVYSELKGEGTATGKRISGTFVGGTGRYAGATGAYEFSWRFVIDTEDGRIQGQSDGLNGRISVGSPPAPSSAGGPQQ